MMFVDGPGHAPRETWKTLRANRFAVDALVLLVLLLIGIALFVNADTIIAAGLLGIALGTCLANPRAAVAAIPMALPFVQRPISAGGGEWSLLELSILISAATVGIRVLAGSIKKRSFAQIASLLMPYSLTATAALLIGAGAVSLFFVADPRFLPESLREFRWVIVEPVAALFLFRWLLRAERGRSLLLASLIGAGMVVAVVGGIQLVTGHGVVAADGVERATGPYSHPNNLALYLERVAVLALAIAVAYRHTSRLAGISAIVCGLGLAATLSRGAVLAYLTGAVWVIGVTRVRHGWRWIAAGIAVGLMLIVSVAGERLIDSGSAGSTSSRELIWSASIEMIKDHPVTGIGLDQFFNQYGRRYVEPAGWPERYTSHPHNVVLDVWLRLGLAGMVVFGLLIAAVIQVARRPVDGVLNRSVWIGAVGALLAGAAHGLFDNSFFLPDLAVLTWLMIALLESSTAPAERRVASYG